MLCVALLTTLFSCKKDELPEQLHPECENLYDVPAGEFTLPFSIPDFEKYEDKYDLDLSVSVYDEDNEPISVKNNRKIVVEEDKKYTVLVLLYAVVNGERVVRTHEFFIESQHSARTVSFVYDEDEAEIETRTVPYGGSIEWNDLPEIADRYFVSGDDLAGYTEILSKKWVVYNNKGQRDLVPEDLQNITSSFQVYAYLEYRVSALPIVVHFESNGGTEIPDYHTDTQTALDRQPSPEKDGYAFIGWCFDEECTSFYDWTERTYIPEDFTLYAKYVKNNDDVCTPVTLFVFTKGENEYGNAYYSLRPKDPQEISGELVLPTCYRGLPVVDIDDDAFSGSPVTDVFIPYSYHITGQRQFSDCTSLVSVTFEEGSRCYLLPDYFLSGCIALETIVLPDRLMRIQPHAFYGCLSLSSVSLPSTLERIELKAFAECKSLTSLTIPDNVTTIEDGTFMGSSNFSEIKFSRNSRIQYIGYDAFDDTLVTEIILPSSLRTEIVFDGDVDKIHIRYYSNAE